MIPFVNFWENNGIPLTWQPKSQSMTWFSSDSEENFLKRDNNVFVPESFGYTFNEYGYRIGDRDWDLNTNKKRIITLGCSHTVGVGVPYEKAWPTLFAEELSAELFNLAVTGTSADTVFRTLYHSIDIIKPDVVAIFWPEMIRWETYEAVLWDCTGAECSTPGNGSVWNTDIKLINESHITNLSLKNIELVKLLQKLHGFKLVDLYSQTVIKDYLIEYNHLKYPYDFDSRDRTHPGLTMHQYIKNKFIDKYSNS
jgi:hypothetical protein